MIPEFDRRIQKLFDIHDEIRKAELAHGQNATRSKLVDGLQESCLLLKDMLTDAVLLPAEAAPEAWHTFQTLKSENRLNEFLDLERRLLGITKLRPETVDYIVDALHHVVDVMIEEHGHLSAGWRIVLADLSHQVCETGTTAAQSLDRRPLLRRALLAGGGGLVAILNLVPPPFLPVFQPVATMSVSLGTWLIAKAADGFLDAWVEG